MMAEHYKRPSGIPALAGLEVAHAVASEAPGLTYWESAATTKWGSYLTELERQSILQGQSLAGKPTRALEVGCEGGRWSKMLADLGWQMTCIDVNRQCLDECQRKAPHAKCILANPADRAIPCDSGAVALLLCIEVAPVIQSDWFLSEAHRLLGNNGVLVGVLLNRASWRGLLTRMKYRFASKSNGD